MSLELCPCGTGLRNTRCCGLVQGSLPDPDNAALLTAPVREAFKLYNEKNYAEAEVLALKLLDLNPHHRSILRVLFEIRRGQKRQKAAEVLCRRLADLPGTAVQRSAANSLLAQYIIGQGRYEEAYAPAAQAIIAAPKDAGAQHIMGIILTETGSLQAGEHHYRRALQLAANRDGLLLANLAWNLKLQGRLEESAPIYEKSLLLKADNKKAIGGFAQVEFARGNTERAQVLLDSALTSWPEDRTLRLLRVYADLQLGDAEAVLARLPDDPGALLAPELSVRGQALAALRREKEAVEHYTMAKSKLRGNENVKYQIDEVKARIASYKSYFTTERTLVLPRPSPSKLQPIFLLGFPRSGTSLLEQLLAQIPGFAVGTEIMPLDNLIQFLSHLAGPDAPAYPEAIDYSLLGDGALIPGEVRARYWSSRAASVKMRPDARFVTDRAHSNMWHLGLIKLLFPDAPIIHVLRHPLDIMLSNLAQDRKQAANSHISMRDTAQHYVLSMDMIKFYRGQFNLRYLHIRYEDLVRDPKATLHGVSTFLGLDPTDLPSATDLQANAAPLPTPTPAHFVARESLHTRSLYRYREYEKLMPDLFRDVHPFLATSIAEQGYEEYV